MKKEQKKTVAEASNLSRNVIKTSVKDDPKSKADSNKQIKIRVATSEDVELITKLHSLSWRNTYKGILSNEYLNDKMETEKRQHWARQLPLPANKYDFVLVALKSEKVVGFIGVYNATDGNYDAFIDNLHVLPEEKGKGIGVSLMVAAAKKLKSYKKKSVYLWVYDDNIAAFGFYKKLGGITADKNTCVIDGREIQETRIYWDDFTNLKLQSKD